MKLVNRKNVDHLIYFHVVVLISVSCSFFLWNSIISADSNICSHPLHLKWQCLWYSAWWNICFLVKSVRYWSQKSQYVVVVCCILCVLVRKICLKLVFKSNDTDLYFHRWESQFYSNQKSGQSEIPVAKSDHALCKKKIGG